MKHAQCTQQQWETNVIWLCLWSHFRSSETNGKIIWFKLSGFIQKLTVISSVALRIYFKSWNVVKLLLQFRCDGAILSSCPGFLIIFRWLTICCRQNEMNLLFSFFFFQKIILLTSEWIYGTCRTLIIALIRWNQIKKHLLHVINGWICVSVNRVWSREC